MPRIIIVSNRLPVTIHPDRPPPGDVEKSSGGLVSAFRGIMDSYEQLVWIGWPGSHAANEADEQRIAARLYEESSSFQLIPVWLSQAEVEDFYSGFSNSSLWPLLHWMTPYARFKKAWATSYRSVNDKFAEAILNIATPSDLIWIQDYHLFLVPKLLRQKHDSKVTRGDLQRSGHVQRPKDLPPPIEDEGGVSPSGSVPRIRPAYLPPPEERPEGDADGCANDPPQDRGPGAAVSEVDLEFSDVDMTRSHRESGDGPCVDIAEPEEGKLRIAFFLHTPFPSYEVISALPQCLEIMRGVLGADLIGFHTYGYLRHFRSCVIRVCGFTPEIDHVDHRGQRTRLGVFPIGANCQVIYEAMRSERFVKHLSDYTEQFKGRSLVLSVERLDYSKGIPQRLAAIRRYLEEAHQKETLAAEEEDGAAGSVEERTSRSRLEDLLKRFQEPGQGNATEGSLSRLEDWHQGLRRINASVKNFFSNSVPVATEPLDHAKTVFVFVAVPSRQDVQEYKDIEEEVHRSISTINGQFSTITHQPIVYIHRSVQTEELQALYARSDCCLVTPLIDGMNLVAKEFVAAKDKTVENVVPGTLVISELAGAAQELFDAIVVNPYDEDAVAEAITVGLELARGNRLSEAQRWEMTDKMRQSVLQNDAVAWAKGLLGELQRPRDEKLAKPAEASQLPLDDTAACLFFRKAKGTKALFLDYDGTLREFESRPEDAVPSGDGFRELFQGLAAREDLKVFIVSGRDKEFLELHFGAYESFTLIAEHGFVMLGTDTAREWRTINPYTNTEWKHKIKPVMELFTRCTPGARIEDKSSSIVWHYRECDDEYGQFKAKELMYQLALSVGNLPCQISQGTKIVEVASLQVTKGLVVRSACLERRASGDPFSAVLCLGDSPTDESMFQEAPPGSHTVNVGQRETCAKYRLQDPADVRRFLKMIVDQCPPVPKQLSPVFRDSSAVYKSIDEGFGGRSADLSDLDPLAGLPEHETWGEEADSPATGAAAAAEEAAMLPTAAAAAAAAAPSPQPAG